MQSKHLLKKITKRQWLGYGIAILLVLGGGYMLLLVLSPNLPVAVPLPGERRPPSPQRATLTEDRLYIPRIGVNLAYAAGDKSVLNDKVWHRYPERGDPERGGNFILAAHRFELGFWPGETRYKSPFYHIDAVLAGDYIYVDFKGVRYQYVVTKRYKVPPTQTSIEAPSDNPKLTLYSCTFRGSNDGREVIEAQIAAKNINPTMALAMSSQN